LGQRSGVAGAGVGRVPVLLCAGTKDRELSAAQVESLRLTRSGMEARTFEGLDHAFAGPEGRVDPDFLKFLAERVPKTLQ
jgi:surfactin synthase thioesterase subunit